MMITLKPIFLELMSTPRANEKAIVKRRKSINYKGTRVSKELFTLQKTKKSLKVCKVDAPKKRKGKGEKAKCLILGTVQSVKKLR